MKIRINEPGIRGRIYVLKSVDVPKRFRCWSWSALNKLILGTYA